MMNKATVHTERVTQSISQSMQGQVVAQGGLLSMRGNSVHCILMMRTLVAVLISILTPCRKTLTVLLNAHDAPASTLRRPATAPGLSAATAWNLVLGVQVEAVGDGVHDGAQVLLHLHRRVAEVSVDAGDVARVVCHLPVGAPVLKGAPSNSGAFSDT